MTKSICPTRFKVENNGIIETLFDLIFSVFDKKGQFRMKNPDTGNIGDKDK